MMTKDRDTPLGPPAGRPAAARAWGFLARTRPGATLPDILIYILWAALALTAMLTHEPCRDEAQKWLIARDAPSLGEIFRLMPYEGSPVLWTLILRPFARLGFPYATAGWINWLFAAAAAALFWFRAPLPRWFKILFLFSYHMVYDFPAISRNYAASVFFLFGLLAIYPSRREKSLPFVAALFLLINTNVLGAISAAALAAMFLWDLLREAGRRRDAIWSAVAVASAYAALAVQVIPRRTAGTVSEVLETGPDMELLLYNLHYSYPWTMRIGSGALNLILLGGPIFLSLYVIGIMTRPRSLLLCLASVSFPFFLFYRGYVGLQWLGYVFVGVAASAWLAGLEPAGWVRARAPQAQPGALARFFPKSLALLCFPLALSVGFGVRNLVRDGRLPFSGSRAAAAFIRNRGLDRVKIASVDVKPASILPYLDGVPFYYLSDQRWGTYFIQDDVHKAAARIAYKTAVDRAFTVLAGESLFLIVTDNAINPLYLRGACRLLYQITKKEVFEDETVFIYGCCPPPARPAAAAAK